MRRAAFLTSLVKYDKILSKFGQQNKGDFCLRMREKSQKLFLFHPFRTCIAGSAVFRATEFVNPTFEGDSFFTVRRALPWPPNKHFYKLANQDIRM